MLFLCLLLISLSSFVSARSFLHVVLHTFSLSYLFKNLGICSPSGLFSSSAVPPSLPTFFAPLRAPAKMVLSAQPGAVLPQPSIYKDILLFFFFPLFLPFPFCGPTLTYLAANQDTECVTVSWIPEWSRQGHNNT